jgi:dTMP kinase
MVDGPLHAPRSSPFPQRAQAAAPSGVGVARNHTLFWPLWVAMRVRDGGFLLTCEGIDGSGKTTACRGLAAALRARGLDVREHVEPTATWLGEAVRRGFKEDVSPWTEALLFMADHATHVARVREELEAGAVVVSDRWSDSTFAYQGAALARPDFDATATLRAMERPFDLAPHLTLLFDLDPEEAMRRVGARGAQQEKFEKLDFLQRVRANYLRLAREEPARFVIIDASRAPADVLATALAVVVARLS